MPAQQWPGRQRSEWRSRCELSGAVSGCNRNDRLADSQYRGNKSGVCMDWVRFNYILAVGLLVMSSPVLAASYAELDSRNVVLRVVEIADSVEGGSEARGAQYCAQLLGGVKWIKTGAGIRKNFAGSGYTYDASLDAFVPPQPWPSWVFDVATANWVAPVPHPTDGQAYYWDEASKSWKVM